MKQRDATKVLSQDARQKLEAVRPCATQESLYLIPLLGAVHVSHGFSLLQPPDHVKAPYVLGLKSICRAVIITELPLS